MTYFKLSLLTPQFSNNTNYFFEDVISEFYSQQDIYKNNKFLDPIRQDGIDSYHSSTDAINSDILDQKSIFCYSYNEKLVLGINAQKTLSFSMNRMVTIENEWKENPFIRNIAIGTQLLLTDKFNNEYFFTITEIKYNIKENNIIYDISCQDTFSYQTIRQNSGYTIENDSASEDFIGALTIDEWVKEYIIPDCHLSYQYIPLTDYLYEDYNNQLHIVPYTNFVNHTLTNVKRILKYGYNPNIEYDLDNPTKIINAHDSAFFDTIPFSCSDSNANAALISLGSQIGFVLNTCERAQLIDYTDKNNSINQIRTKIFDKFFWLEAEKNQNRLGLTYSPKNSIQNFNFSHKGDSLTTVLNVESIMNDDEVVSMFPTIPPIFYRWFSSTDWQNTGYYPGMFSQLCENQIFVHTLSNNDILSTDNKYWFFTRLDELASQIECQKYDLTKNNIAGVEFDDVTLPFPDEINQNTKPWNKEEGDTQKPETLKKYFYFPVYTDTTNYTFNLPFLYEHVSFKDYKARDISELLINGNTYTSRGYTWDLILLNKYKDKDNNNKYRIYIIREDLDTIPNLSQGQVYAFIRIYINHIFSTLSVRPELYINFYRNATAEEKEFAEIADSCPWLENKIIDFSYFYKNKILSRAEYSQLMDIFYNNLRKINGKLMFFSQAYYNALHNRTKLLATLTNSLDMLGATCESDIVTPMQKKGVITSFESFKNSYIDFTAPVANIIALSNYADIKTDYFNKYFNAQQRFLKNIYNFRNYFNAQNSLNKTTLYNYTLNITDNIDSILTATKPNPWPQGQTNIPAECDYYSFYQIGWQNINNNFKLYNESTKTPLVSIYQYKQNQYQSIIAVDAVNYKNYYIPTQLAGDKQFAFSFVEDGQYLREALAILIYKNDINNKFYWEDGISKSFTNEIKITTNDNDIYITSSSTNDFTSTIQWKIIDIRLMKDNNISGDHYFAICYKVKDTKTNWLSLMPVHYIRYKNINSTQINWDLSPLNRILYEAVYKSEMINNYLNGLDTTNTILDTAFWRGTNNYNGVLDWSIAKTNLQTDCLVSLLQDYKNDTSLDFSNYKDYIPINEVYYPNSIPEYNITQTTINSCSYYAFTFNKDTQYLALSYVNKDNASNYYRMVTQSGAGVVCSYIGAFLVVGVGMLAAMPWIWMYGANSIPGQSGHTVKDVFGQNVSLTCGWDDYYDTNEYYRYFVNNDSMEKFQIYKKQQKSATGPENSYIHNAVWSDNELLPSDSKLISIYWPLLAYSYNQAINKNLKYQTNYLYLLNPNSLITNKDIYKVFLIREDLKWNLLFTTIGNCEHFINYVWNTPLSTIAYYPIIAKGSDLDLSEISFEDNQPKTLEDIIKSKYSQAIWEGDGTQKYCTITQNNTKLSFLIAREEAYSRDFLTNNHYIQRSLIPDLYNTNKRIYDINNIEIDYTKLPIYEGYYLVNEKDSNFITPTIFNEDTIYYSLINNTYKRQYTLKQMKSNTQLTFKYLTSTIYNTISFDENQPIFENVPLTKTHYSLLWENNNQIYPTIVSATTETEKNFINIAFTDSSSLLTYDFYNLLTADNLILCEYTDTSTTKVKKNNQIIFTVTKTRDEGTYIGDMSNGTFWYNFRDNLTIPTLYQHAAAIETQLTEYWTLAYTASKYCEYMLPESWTPYIEQNTNYFSSSIIKLNDKNQLILKNDFLPIVDTYSENGEIRLNKYKFTHKDCKSVNNYNALNRASQYSYNSINLNNQINIQQSIANNPALSNLFNILNEDANNWIFTKIGKTTYYYVTDKDSGKTWDQFIYQATKNQFNKYSGIYVMGYHKLQEAYTNLDDSEYWTTKLAHDTIWNNLYSTYGYLLLENTYKSETATTSSELLQLAKYAFKDYNKPEANYSITVIDTASLSGYNGQEIRIGDGIRVNAQDYYNEYDQIFDSLSEYLFITDINYSLRSPTDISLTVNAIKYQDKLIQKLVKLIK